MANWLSRLGGLFKKGDAERPPDPLDILISLIDPADPRTKIRPLGGDWLCPFSGKRFLVPHWDGVTDILQVPEIMEHLLSLPEIKRQGAAAQMRPWPELAEIVTVMRLREAQNYRILSERGEWYCPFCCINTGIERRQWDGSETPLEWFIPAALKHLQQCKDYLANRLTAKSVPELLRAKGDRAIRAELLSRVCHEEIFRVCADTGAWVCPFSQRAIMTINLHAVPWGEQVQEAIVSYLMSPECPGRDTLWRTAVTVADLQRAAGRLSAGHAARAEAAEELQALRKRVDNLSATATSALEVQKELRAARAAQLKMLPSRPPLIPGYEVASFYEASVELGGDLYHFLEVRPGFTGFLVGDVSGHGVEAAVIMSMALKSFSVRCVEVDYPAAVMAAVHKDLIKDILPGRFVSAFYGILNHQAGTLRCARGGHPPPLLVQPADGSLRKLEGKGLALGIGAPDLYARKLEEYEIALLPGAVLLLYTDGISEAMNDKHEESTDERLQDVFLGCAHLPPQQVIDQILTAVRGHAGARPMEDDLTLVVLKRLP